MKDKKERNRIAVKKYRRKNPGYWKNWKKAPVENLLLWRAKVNARQKSVPYDLDKGWIKEHWSGKCELSGIVFRPSSIWRTQYSPSIDRIVPEKGYIKTNCRFILWGLNAFKGLGSDEEMYNIAKALLDYKRKTADERNSRKTVG